MPQSQNQSVQSDHGKDQQGQLSQPVSLLNSYRNAGGSFDELLTSKSEIRPAWHQFTSHFNRLGKVEFTRRWEQSQRLIYENGLAYSPYGDPDASGRPWELDAMPLVLSSVEWDEVAKGVAQRAQVFQLVLQDLLGPQRLLRDGILPSSLLFDHPGFRLPYLGLENLKSYMPFYAGDLGRSPDGRWWLMADRTESPSGIGFALENRVVISRMMPDIFRKCYVQRLAPFFKAFKSNLQQQSWSEKENPRVVLFSRGMQDTTYFEDAYLARYLGYTLTEGADLTVRDNKVWLKTLDGLLPVDVLLRRPNSEACDPLEFSDNTIHGITGLLHAARNGNIAIANPLGSGLVESPVFMAFMPALCKYFLDQELILPGIATWWCGDPKSCEHVIANLDKLVISPAYRRRGKSQSIRASMRELSHEELSSRIKRQPHLYVGQERLNFSTAPVWKEGQLQHEKLVMRAFATAGDDCYKVMDGGLARTSNPNDVRHALSHQVVPTGQGSKDTWIVGTEPVEPVTLLSSQEKIVELRRTGSDLSSRVADNIYWLGRQIARADASARLLRSVIFQMTSETADGSTAALPPLLRSLAKDGQIEPGYVLEDIKKPLPDIHSSLPRSVLDPNQAGSLRAVFKNIFRLASLVRDRLSIDTWRIFVRMDQRFTLRQLDSNFDLTDLLTLINQLITDLAAVEGMVMESMTRSHVFQFLDLGRRLERAMQTCELTSNCFVENQSVSAELLETVLEISASLMTYRTRYLANLQLAAVLDLLITDETNPRSIAYQLAMLQKHINELPADSQPGHSELQRLIMSLVHLIRMVDVHDVSDSHRMGDLKPLNAPLTTLASDLPRLSNLISQRYLVHIGPARMMSSATVTQQ